MRGFINPQEWNNTGRPLKDISEEQVFELAKIQCTKPEMAAVLGCDPKTLYNRFSHIIQEGKEAGKKSLRRAQWDRAVKDNNTTMQIWLGKQYLGQRDNLEFSGPEGKAITFNLTTANPPKEIDVDSYRDTITTEAVRVPASEIEGSPVLGGVRGGEDEGDMLEGSHPGIESGGEGNSLPEE